MINTLMPDEKNICISNDGEIYINGQKLPTYFKLSFLIKLLGEPDNIELPKENKKKLLIYSWYDYGLDAISFYGHKGYVGILEIYAKETIHVSHPAVVDIVLRNTKIEQAEPCEGYFKRGKHFVVIRSFNREHKEECRKGEIAMLQINYGFYPTEYLIAADRGDKEKILSLIEQGRNINSKSGPLFETPLMLAVRTDKLDIVNLLLANGADPDIPDVYGRTPRKELKSRGVLFL